jgi:Concanavalin A-like lectin/glucanases superfamily
MSFLSVRNGIPVGVSPHLAIVGALIQAFSPASLFAAGEQGAWYDPSDLTTLFQDSAGTTPVTAVEQPVGLMRDKSGRGNHAFQSTSASRPVLSARVNLLTKTEQFDDAVWGKTASSITADSTISPNGANTADLFIPNTSATAHYLSSATTLQAGAATYSIYAKSAGYRYLVLLTPAGNVSFDLFNGVVANTSVATGAIVDVGSGWYRCILTATQTANPTVYISGGSSSAAGFFSGAGDGTSGVYIWGADLRVSNDGVGIPSYQRVNTSTDYDTTGFPLYLKFDGIDDGLQTNSIDFSSGDKMTVWAGVRKLSDAGNGSVVELSAAADANNGAFFLRAPAGGLPNYQWLSNGTLNTTATPSPYVAPITNVLTGIGDISGDQCILRVNGTQAASSTADQGTGNYGNYPLYIGRRGGASLPFNGRLNSLIIRGAQSTDAQISAAETWVNGKTKAF